MIKLNETLLKNWIEVINSDYKEHLDLINSSRKMSEYTDVLGSIMYDYDKIEDFHIIDIIVLPISLKRLRDMIEITENLPNNITLMDSVVSPFYRDIAKSPCLIKRSTEKLKVDNTDVNGYALYDLSDDLMKLLEDYCDEATGLRCAYITKFTLDDDEIQITRIPRTPLTCMFTEPEKVINWLKDDKVNE